MSCKDEVVVEVAMIKRAFEPDRWSFTDMCGIERRIVQADPDHFGRIADKIMQHWRRKGWAMFVRVGRVPLWSLTDTGRDVLKIRLEAIR